MKQSSLNHQIRRTRASLSISLCETLKPSKPEEALRGKTSHPTEVCSDLIHPSMKAILSIVLHEPYQPLIVFVFVFHSKILKLPTGR